MSKKNLKNSPCNLYPIGYILTMKVTFYTTASGRSPVLDYVHDLSKPERARLLEALHQVEQYGFDAVRTQFRQIEGKLWEIKVSAHRVFYVMVQQEEMVLLHAYKKQGQKLPLREREVALKRMKEVLS